MKNLTFYLTILGLGFILLFPSIGYPQKEKEALSKNQPQGEIAPDSDQYIIGPEDVLYIHTWKEEALSRTVPVRTDGKISLPLINEVQAAGLTPLQLREILIEKCRKYIDKPNVAVIVMEANGFKVYISGNVKSPGMYKLRNENSLLQLIPMAGGFTNYANKKKVLIIRNENGTEKRIKVNYKNIVEGKDPISNCILKPGDTIIVP